MSELMIMCIIAGVIIGAAVITIGLAIRDAYREDNKAYTRRCPWCHQIIGPFRDCTCGFKF